MDLKACSENELLQEMLPDTGRQAWQIEAAWREFIQRFEPVLIRSVRIAYRRYAPSAHPTLDDIHDLVQQIFIKISEDDYRALRELKCYRDNSVKLYLCAIAANITIDYLRAAGARRRPAITHSLNDPTYSQEGGLACADYLVAPGANPEENYLHKEMLDRVLAVVDAESDEKTRARNRLIFFLAHRDGYSSSEIAARDDINLKRTGVNSFLNRVKKRLEEFYSFNSTEA